jgi:NDP-sugar pyrophosphorylase family protein
MVEEVKTAIMVERRRYVYREALTIMMALMCAQPSTSMETQSCTWASNKIGHGVYVVDDVIFDRLMIGGQ